MKEGSVDHQACPQQPCRGQSPGEEEVLSALCTKEFRTTHVWVYIKFLGTEKLQTWIQGLGLNGKTYQEQA